MVTAGLTIPLCVVLFYFVPKSNMPYLEYNEVEVKVEWNENIHTQENKQRTDELLKSLTDYTIETATYIGTKQYLLEKENNLTTTEAEVYIKAKNPKEIDKITEQLRQWAQQKYPKATLSFAPPKNVFEKIFDTDEPEVIVQLQPKNKYQNLTEQAIEAVQKQVAQLTGISANQIPFDEQLVISIDKEQLIRYRVDYGEVQRCLKTAFKSNEITTLRSYQQYLPITLSGNNLTINEVLQNTMVTTSLQDAQKQYLKVPLSAFVSTTKSTDLKTIVSGKNGQYIPLVYPTAEKPTALINTVETNFRNNPDWEAQFAGAFFSSEKMLSELVVVLLISVLLMYFILAAQFESFVQPLIVLAELPIDIAAALLLFYLTGHTLNLMSAIGIVVSCGIIINDSILKIDMINELRKAGTPLLEAIHQAGEKRLRSIMMTTLTTVLAMVPLLFSFDMGSELQKPLAVAMIGTMLIGTAVSLFVIPLVYWWVYKGKR